MQFEREPAFDVAGDVERRDARALLREERRDAHADAGARARDDRCLAVESKHDSIARQRPPEPHPGARIKMTCRPPESTPEDCMGANLASS